jgi:hypothetical protein
MVSLPMHATCRSASRMVDDDRRSSSYFDDMSVNLEESRRFIDAPTSNDPEVGLTAVVALRQLLLM